MKRDSELGFEPGKEQEEQVEMQIANRKYTVYFCSSEEPAACAARHLGVSCELG